MSNMERAMKRPFKFDTKKIMQAMVREAGIGAALLLLILFFAVTTQKFATFTNFTNIMQQISINTVIAIGMTFVILLGGIDLSVGSVLALSTVVSGLVLRMGFNGTIPVGTAIPLAVVLSILVAGFCGLLNGLVTERWKIHSFIVTLGMLNIARGAARQISGSRTIYEIPPAFNNFGTTNIIGIPIIFIITVVLVIAGIFVLRKTVFGRMIYAIGNNEEAVKLSGHNTTIFKIAAFVICGAMVGIAAVLYMLRLNIGDANLGGGFELHAIAAVVIGGTSMNGGKGSITGTFLGACIMGVLNNGLLLIGMGDFTRQMVTGGIIVGAVIIDTYRAKLSAKLMEA